MVRRRQRKTARGSIINNYLIIAYRFLLALYTLYNFNENYFYYSLVTVMIHSGSILVSQKFAIDSCFNLFYFEWFLLHSTQIKTCKVVYESNNCYLILKKSIHMQNQLLTASTFRFVTPVGAIVFTVANIGFIHASTTR